MLHACVCTGALAHRGYMWMSEVDSQVYSSILHLISEPGCCKSPASTFLNCSPTCSTRVIGTWHHIPNFCEHQGSKLRSSFLCSQHFTQWVLPNPNLKYFNLVWLTWRGNRNIYLHIFFVWNFLWVRNLLLSVLIILWMNASYRC